MYSCNAAKREHPPPTSLYKREMHVNGTVYTKNYLKHNELLQGGVIDFKMTDRPNMQRGTKESKAP